MKQPGNNNYTQLSKEKKKQGKMKKKKKEARNGDKKCFKPSNDS